MIGHKMGTPMRRWRRMLTKYPGQFLPRALVFVSGIIWIDIERPEVDYREYLGPDWTPSYEGASTLLFNHSSWMVGFI